MWAFKMPELKPNTLRKLRRQEEILFDGRLLCLELFPFGSEAQFSFFQYDCAQQFHLLYGAHVRCDVQ